MPGSLRAIAGGAALLGTLAGIGYTALAIARVRAFGRRETPIPAEFPAMTVLKPLHGGEPDLYENLRTFCTQEYPSYQVIFGAADPNDPALNAARRLRDELPACDITIVAGQAVPAANPKVGNLLGMYPYVKHGIVVVADSDIAVEPHYLRALAAGFADEATGAVTCLYGAAHNGTLASQLGAQFVNDQFAPSVLVGQTIEPLTYCFGATMAVRKDVLERIGGFEALRDHLGDDYLLGNLVARAGMRVDLSRYVVRTQANEPNLAALYRREVRWARTIRTARPAGYAGSVVTYVLPWAALYAALARTPVSMLLLGAAAAVRFALHRQTRNTFAPAGADAPALIPLRDAMSLAIWAAAFFGGRVVWRDAALHVMPGGALERGTSGPKR